MTYDPENLPDDPEQLKAIIASLQGTIDKLGEEIHRQSQESSRRPSTVPSTR